MCVDVSNRYAPRGFFVCECDDFKDCYTRLDISPAEHYDLSSPDPRRLLIADECLFRYPGAVIISEHPGFKVLVPRNGEPQSRKD